MLLEEAAQIGLVGEFQTVGDLLHRQVRRTEHHPNLQHHRPVDKLLGRSVRHGPHNGRKVTGRNTEFVGIEGDLPLLSTILVHELRKTVEQLHLPGGVLEDPGLFASKALHLVVNLQQDILQAVLDDRVAE